MLPQVRAGVEIPPARAARVEFLPFMLQLVAGQVKSEFVGGVAQAAVPRSFVGMNLAVMRIELRTADEVPAAKRTIQVLLLVSHQGSPVGKGLTAQPT